MRRSLELRNIGPIREANLVFGDLTVLVGPQATGKSITLQWLKLLCDTGHVQAQLFDYGMAWQKDVLRFIDLFFGEGMHTLWNGAKSTVRWNGKPWNASKKIAK